MEKINHLIHAKWVVTCNAEHSVLENHSLAIQDGKILAIGPSDEIKKTYQAKHQHSYDSHIVMPGLINSHTHIAMNAFRGLADDMELMTWLTKYIWPAEGKWVSQELVYDMSLLAIAEMIRGGTTCFNDMYFYLHDTAKAALTAGLRAHIGMTVIDVPTAWAKTTEEYFDKALAFYDEYKNHPLIQPTLAPHSTYTVSPKNLERIKQLSEEYKIKINIHLQEAPSEITQSLNQFKMRPIELLESLGFLSKDVIAIHMTQISESDFSLIEKNQLNIVHCPESNMKLASGSCPVQRLLDLGINVALGTDGAASNNDLDMFGEMRSAALFGKIVTNNPEAVKASDVIKMATIRGARTLGIHDVTGSLEVGKSADFIALDMNCIETQPFYHPISQLVYSTPRTQVTDVWVAGKELMRQRQLMTLNEAEIIEKAKIWRTKIRNSV